MGLSLILRNSRFRTSILESAAAVKPFGVDLLAEFEFENGFKDSSRSALGLTAIQLGLVDVLRDDYGITPAGMLGHSAGELPKALSLLLKRLGSVHCSAEPQATHSAPGQSKGKDLSKA